MTNSEPENEPEFPEQVTGVNEDTGVEFCARCGQEVPHECMFPDQPVLGVLTGQVPVESMPIALSAPEGVRGENLPPKRLDGEMIDEDGSA